MSSFLVIQSLCCQKCIDIDPKSSISCSRLVICGRTGCATGYAAYRCNASRCFLFMSNEKHQKRTARTWILLSIFRRIMQYLSRPRHDQAIIIVFRPFLHICSRANFLGGFHSAINIGLSCYNVAMFQLNSTKHIFRPHRLVTVVGIFFVRIESLFKHGPAEM